jgi:hypothetical protein
VQLSRRDMIDRRDALSEDRCVMGIAPPRSALTVSQRASKNVRATVASRARFCTTHRGRPSREALYRKVFTTGDALGTWRPARPLRCSAPTRASRTARDASHRGQRFAGEAGTVSACARFSNTHLANQEGKMVWIVIIALAVTAFGLVKARRRKAASGAAHQ